MLEQLKIAYTNHLWFRLAVCIGLFIYGVLLYWLPGGFPPWAWLFLFHTLPQIPGLWQIRGAAILVPLLGLLVFSVTLLVLWVVLVTAWWHIVSYWYRERQEQRRFASEWQEAEQIAQREAESGLQEAEEQEHTTRVSARREPVGVAATTPPQWAVSSVRHTAQTTTPSNVAIVPLPLAAPPVGSAAQAQTQQTRQPSLLVREQLRLISSPNDEDDEPDTVPCPMYQDEDEDDEPDTVPFPMLQDEDEDEHDAVTAKLNKQEEFLRFIVGVGSDPGIKRKNAPNEDSLLAIQGTCVTPIGPQPVGLFVVADGMGGHANGQEASRLAVQAFSDVVVPALLHSVEDEEIFVELLKDGVHRANLSIYQRNKGQEHMMGTTITAALIVGATAYVANVGDSRTYIYHQVDGLSQVTRDHSHVALLVENGSITHDEIYTHPQRNQIYRCLGEHASAQVDIFTVSLQAEDMLLLCSDGLWEMVRDPEIEKIITSSISQPSHTSSTLIDATLHAGGADNVSVVAVSVVRAD